MNFTPIYITFLIVSTIYRFRRLSRTHLDRRESGEIFVKPIYKIMFLLYFMVMISAIVEYFLLDRRINLVLSGIGFLMYVSVIPVREWAIRSLGKFMSEHIEIKMGHKLVKEGPYKYLRHPLLSCLLIETTAITLIPNSYYSLIGALMLYFPLAFIRMYLEERVLIEKLGQEYLDYKKEVPGLIPLKLKDIR